MNELTLLKPKLLRLKMSGILETIESRLKAAQEEKWTYTNFLLSLFSDEIERREFKQLSRRLSKSSLDPAKTLESFDFLFNPKIHEPTFKELSNCNFMEKKENIFIVGPSGVGKTHLSQALAHEAIRRGHDVLFKRTNKLLQWVASGMGDGSYERRMNQVIRIPLLILDDFGLTHLKENEQSDLYEIICERYEKNSTILTSNRDFEEWIAIFSNPLMGSAAMDRLVHKGIKIVIEGKSYRNEVFSKKDKSLTKK